MPLSASEIDRTGRHLLASMGSAREAVTLVHKGHEEATPVTVNVLQEDCLLQSYRQADINLETILQNDLRCRIRVGGLSVIPTRWDTVLRSDGSQWRVVNVSGGPGHPLWDMTLRQVA